MNSILFPLLLSALTAAPAPETAPTAAPAPSAAATPAPEASALPLLHLEDAIRAAIEAQPTLRQARAQTLVAAARAAESRAALLPQLDATGSYARSSGATAVPGLTKSYDLYAGQLRLSQSVFNFGAINGFRSASATARAQRASEIASRDSTILNVRATFFSARGAKALMKVAEETVENQRRHLGQIEGFVEVGTRPQIDLVQARSDLATADVQRINAENGYRTAKAQLQQAMGREGPVDFEVADDQIAEVPGEDAAPEVLFDEALQARPDLRALEAQVQASELALTAAHGGYLPSLGVSATGTTSGPDLGSLERGWTAGATLTWNLFAGGLTSAQVDEADGNLMSLKAQRDAIRQQISLDVEQARLAVGAAKAALLSAQTALENAKERLSLAEARYQTGVGSIIELGDAQVAETNAAGLRVQADYNLAAARAQLLRALGRE